MVARADTERAGATVEMATASSAVRASPPPGTGKRLRVESLLHFGRGNRLPVVLQTELAECGLACLAMVASYHGYETDLVSLRRRFSVSSHGVSLKHLRDIAARMHLAPRVLKADEPDDLASIPLPCVLHWGMNHFVVLKAIERRGVGAARYVVHDPAFGERKLDRTEFDKLFTGIVLELTPTRDFTKADERSTLRFGDFWSRATGLKRSLVQIILLSLLLQVFALVSPFYMQIVIDDVLLRRDTNLLVVLAVGFGLLMLIQLGTDALREFVVLHLSSRLSIQMSANLFRRLIRLPMDYFSKRHMGDVVSRFGSLNEVQQVLTSGMITAIVDGILALLTLWAMYFYSPQLAGVVLVVVCLYAALRWLLYRPFRLLSEEVIIADANENSHFMESIRAIQTIKLFQREIDRQHEWQNRLANTMNKSIQLARWTIGYKMLNGLLFGLENIIVIYLAATAVMGNLMSIGMLFAFMSFKARFIGAMDSLIGQFIQFRMLDLHFGRLADIALTEPDRVDEHDLHEPRSVSSGAGTHKTARVRARVDIKGKIEVRNLSYRYSEQEPYVFENVSFVILPGETVALTGPSGCGKSTLLRCLMGLATPTSGEVLIDDKPLHTIAGYRSRIAAVMQEDQLLSGDVAENISCFAPHIDMDRVVKCARFACIDATIEAMPMKYNTLVGDMGSSLSGGQKQRIVLARALYRGPRILFMDEATSNLDRDNEMAINRNIRRLNCTRVLVAHRPETVASAGRRIDMADLATPGHLTV